MNSIIPIPKVPLSIHVATMDDLPFMDGLQKNHTKQLGYFPRKQFEGYIEMGAVLVAWATSPCSSDEKQDTGRLPVPLGYIISRDRYLKRDELGVIFQLCVEPGTQRKLVGAALVQAAFERSAYGCRLYCCWCAQDLEANYFWESMGFVPIAFRAGSGKKKRVHIFWQKRIVEGDVETKWWYPFQTSQGAIREDRLVFPIPPGVHWKDVQAVAVEPRSTTSRFAGSPGTEGSLISVDGIANQSIDQKHGIVKGSKRGAGGSVSRCLRGKSSGIESKLPGVTLRRWGAAPPPEQAPPKEPAARKPRPPAAKLDRKFLTAARELRDRYLERINSGRVLGCTNGKYHVSRALPDQSASPRGLPCAPLAA